MSKEPQVIEENPTLIAQCKEHLSAVPHHKDKCYNLYMGYNLWFEIDKGKLTSVIQSDSLSRILFRFDIIDDVRLSYKKSDRPNVAEGMVAIERSIDRLINPPPTAVRESTVVKPDKNCSIM